MAHGINSEKFQISLARIYRGPCFSTSFGTTPTTTITRRDGVEVVQFTKPGTFLVICSRLNHFISSTTGEFQMFGFVRVLPERKQGGGPLVVENREGVFSRYPKKESGSWGESDRGGIRLWGKVYNVSA